MSEKEYDPFEGESGLRDDWDGRIDDAWFAINPNANNAMTCYFKVTDLEEGDEVELRYGCGPEWGSFDGGETIEHPKGDQKRLNNSTAYFAFVKSAMDAGAEEVLRSRSKELGGRGPKDVNLWKGLAFHFEVEQETRNMPDRDNPGKRIDVTITRTLATKFLGDQSGDVAAKAPSAAATTPAPEAPQTNAESASTPVAAAGGGSVLDNLPPELRVKVKVLAQSNDYSTWVDEVMALPGALDDAMLVSELGNQAFYESLK